VKEVVLTKNLGYLQLDTSAVTATIGPTTYGMGTWETTTVGNLFVMREEIDIAGMTVEDLTFFPMAGDVQRAATNLGLAFATGGLIQEWIYVTAAPIDFRVGIPSMTFNLVGQANISETEFQNILWGQSWTWVMNTSVPSNFALPVNTTMMGSGEPTNGDRLYVYRLIGPSGFTPTPGSFCELPSVRLLISGQLKKEEEYSQIMRMRRSYELAQLYDED